MSSTRINLSIEDTIYWRIRRAHINELEHNYDYKGSISRFCVDLIEEALEARRASAEGEQEKEELE